MLVTIVLCEFYVENFQNRNFTDTCKQLQQFIITDLPKAMHDHFYLPVLKIFSIYWVKDLIFNVFQSNPNQFLSHGVEEAV